MNKAFRATTLTCLLALSVCFASPTSVFAGDTNSPGYECTQDCPPPPTDLPPSGAMQSADTDTESPAVEVASTLMGILSGLAGLL